MKKSKNAFTMIELIFVIVILGILAAVAIPNIVATRDDAIIAKTAQNLMICASEIASYAVAQGATETDLSLMSNSIAALSDSGAVVTPGTVTVAMGSITDCVTLQIISGVNDENLTVLFGHPSGDSKCISLQSAINAQEYPIQLRGQLVKQ